MVILVSIETLLIILLALLVFGLLRSHAEIIRAVQSYGRELGRDDLTEASPHDLPPTAGQVVPALGIAGETIDKKPAEYPLWATDDRDTVLAFLTTGCTTCQTFWDAFQSDDLELPSETRLIVVAKDRRHESRARLRRLAPANHDLVLSSDAWTTYQVPASPYFVYITGANAMVAGQGTAESWLQVLNLLALTREEDELAEEEGLGSFAPGATADIVASVNGNTAGDPAAEKAIER
jgi:hypothetical protein